jgi:hypothetical protein
MAAPARRYLAVAGAGFALLVLGAALLSLYVDPYRFFFLQGRLDDRFPRPRATQHIALTKLFGAMHVQPRTLILGNSRAEIGLDPRSQAWPSDWRPVYNGAIPGGWLKSDVDALVLALRNDQVQHVVIGLEFLDFLTDPDSPPPAQDADDDHTSMSGSRKDAVATLLSLDSLIDALRTLHARNDAYSPDITSLGFNPRNEYRLYALREGYGALFLQRDRENARVYARLPKSIYRRDSQTSDAWRQLDRLLSMVSKHDVALTAFVYPYHAHTLELFHSAGLWPAFEAWKLQLARILENSRLPGSEGRCVLWDFSGYHTYAGEQVPDAKQLDAQMDWYWEGGHFKSTLGEIMLSRMLASDASEQDEFGRCLKSKSVPESLRLVRLERERYVARHHSTVEGLARLLPSVR